MEGKAKISPKPKRIKIRKNFFPVNLWFIDFLGLTLAYPTNATVIVTIHRCFFSSAVPSIRSFALGFYCLKQVFKNKESRCLRVRIRPPYRFYWYCSWLLLLLSRIIFSFMHLRKLGFMPQHQKLWRKWGSNVIGKYALMYIQRRIHEIILWRKYDDDPSIVFKPKHLRMFARNTKERKISSVL